MRFQEAKYFSVQAPSPAHDGDTSKPLQTSQQPGQTIGTLPAGKDAKVSAAAPGPAPVASDPAPVGPCNLCGTSNAVMSCGRCHQARYCNRDCQKADWFKGHKSFCRLANPDYSDPHAES